MKGRHPTAAQFWGRIAAYYVVSAGMLWWLLDRHALDKQEHQDVLAWIPAMAVLGGWLSRRRKELWPVAVRAAAAWGLLGITLAAAFTLLLPLLR